MRTIIIDHYENPRNKRMIDDPSYLKIHMNTASCIDDIFVFIKVDNDKIVDAAFDGVGCTIAIASTSIIIDLIIGKSLNEAMYIIEQYRLMLDLKQFDEKALSEAVVFINTSKQPSRIRCAMIGVDGIRQLIHCKECKERG